MPKLFKNQNSDSEEELKINTDYANNYDNWRQKEELHKLKARYGEDAELLINSNEDSSSSSEDDEGEEISEEFEKNFYKTLACLKNKDPKIYNDNVKFFDNSEVNNVENRKKLKDKKEKSLFLRDYERNIMIEKGGKFSDSEDEMEKLPNKSLNPTYVEEQEELKTSFKKILMDEDNQDEDLFLKPKPKTKTELQKEDDDYKEWLKGQKKDINEEEHKALKPLRDFWTDPKLDESEKFLRDYILNKKFLDKESTDNDVSYDHMAHDSDENLSEDERNINQQEEFEHKYNFRFEEPDQEFIKRYPRTLENSLRKKDTRRAQKRAEVKARKEQEKIKRQEELKQLKALKRKEIEEKIEKLKEITGNDDLHLNMVDLEGDFDPDEYDKKMNNIFNETYYAKQDDEVKPEFPDIDKELFIDSTWDNYDPTAEEIAQEEVPYHNVPHCEDPDFNMDADYNAQKDLSSEVTESTKRKRRRRSKFADMISKEKPKFDPAQYSSYQEYYDQYYALNYEDMIGDLPCRFKYRKVVPNDYGLTTEEILVADDKELNKWCSLKRALEYKTEHKELNDVKMYKQKAANEALKRRILKSLYSNPEENTEEPVASTSDNQQAENTDKKRKRNKKSKINSQELTKDNKNDESKVNDISKTEGNNTEIGKDTEINGTEQISSQIENVNSNNKKKRKIEASSTSTNNLEPAKKKKKNKNKQKAENNVQVNNNSVEQLIPNATNEPSTNASKSNSKNKPTYTNLQYPDKTTLSKKEKRKQQFKKKMQLKNKTKEVDQIASLSEERLKAYGLNPKKFKNKLKYMKKNK